MQPAQAELCFIKAVIVLSSGKANQLILRSEGLDDRPAGLAAPSAASDDLSYERKCPLTRAVIAAVQALIGRDNANERYIFKVEPLSDPRG